jgi:hypothetical protein
MPSRAAQTVRLDAAARGSFRRLFITQNEQRHRYAVVSNFF